MLRLLKLVLVLIIVVGATIGGTMLFMSRQGNGPATMPSPVPAELLPTPAPIFSELAPFTVTLYGETRNRILYAGITLRLSNEVSRKIIEDYMPEVRDRTLKVLSSQDAARVQSPNGQELLAEALRTALARPFEPQPEGPQIADVLFTAFVVQ